MTLVSIIVCLILERWRSSPTLIQSYKPLIGYASFLQRHVKTAAIFGSWPGLIIIFFPLVLVVILLQLILHQFWYGILAWFFNTLILLYCLEPHKYVFFYHRWLRQKVTTEPRSESEADALDTSDFLFFNQQIFAVIFWFCLFGGVGALFYRAVTVWRDNAIKAESDLNSYFNLLTRINYYLDWLPVRLLALSFALAGNFTPAFEVIIDGFFQWPENNEAFLRKAGMAALDNNLSADETIVGKLLFRSLIVWLVSLALLTLTALLK